MGLLVQMSNKFHPFQDLQDVDGGYSLPYGPLFMSPKSLAASVLEEVTAGPAAQKARMIARW